MSIPKYMVVIILALVALGTMAYGQYGTQQGQITSLGDKTLTIAGTLNLQGIGTYALLQVSPTRATRAQCIQSCEKSFPDKTSAGYKACVNGCKKVAA